MYYPQPVSQSGACCRVCRTQHRRCEMIRTSAAVLIVNFLSAIACISLNKRVFVYFPYPAALTSIHYFVSWAGIACLRAAGAFQPRSVPPTQANAFYLLIGCWSLCNALSNLSLERNSVGFYQLAKLCVTPTLVCFDFFYYGRTITPLQALALLLACTGVALASVSDVQVTLRTLLPSTC